MKRLLRFWPAALLILLAGAMIAVAILAPKQEEKPKTVLQNTSSEDDDPTEVTLSSEQFSQIQSSLPGFVETTDEEDEESSSDTDSVTSESSETSDTETSDTSSAGTTSSDTGSSDTGSSDETEDDDPPEEPEPKPTELSGVYKSYEAPSLAASRTQSSSYPTKIEINGAVCVFDEASKTLCYAVSQRSIGSSVSLVFGGTYRDQNARVVFPNGEIEDDGSITPNGNQTVKIRIVTDSYYHDCNLRISIIPLLSIETENRKPLPSGSDKTTLFFCTITLQDPNADLHGGDDYVASYATIHLRGASSLSYPKKGVKIELQKFEDGEGGTVIMTERNKDLLGMRKDDDWILDALYADPTLMHNKLSYDLWAEIGGDTNPDALLAGPDCEYVEVFLNGQYHGVHLLVEPVDEKQTGVEKPDANEDGSHGLLIKTTNWDFTKFNEYSGSPYSNGKWATLWKGFEFKCPKSSLTESDWKPILDLLDASVNGTDEEFAKVASKYLDKENMVNYWIFLSVTLARDNAGKNIYWSMANSSVSGSKLYINVWDCDNSFGYRYGKPPVKDPATTANYADKWFVLLRRYLECNVDGAADYLQDRWEELTKNNGLCSVNGLLDRINAEAELLNISGAFAREQARWPKTSSYHGSCPNPLSVEMEYITEWVSDRIPIVDQLVDNYK